MKVKTIYMERYHSRKAVVTQAEAQGLVDTMDAAYAVEQGEVEMIGLDGQRRLVATVLFERIIRKCFAGCGADVDKATPFVLEGDGGRRYLFCSEACRDQPWPLSPPVSGDARGDVGGDHGPLSPTTDHNKTGR